MRGLVFDSRQWDDFSYSLLWEILKWNKFTDDVVNSTDNCLTRHQKSTSFKKWLEGEKMWCEIFCYFSSNHWSNSHITRLTRLMQKSIAPNIIVIIINGCDRCCNLMGVTPTLDHIRSSMFYSECLVQYYSTVTNI